MSGAANTPPQVYRSLKVLTPETFTAFRLDESRLLPFSHPTLHRPRRESIFEGPLLLCPKAASSAGTERGRYSAAVHDGDLTYTESLYGVSFRGGDPLFAYILSGILNSSITAFQLAFGGPTWGLERPTVEPHDLLSLRVPSLDKADSPLLESVLRAERDAAAALATAEGWRHWDRAVFNLYELEPEECVLAADTVDRARFLIFEDRTERARMTKPPDSEVLQEYARRVVGTINTYCVPEMPVMLRRLSTGGASQTATLRPAYPVSRPSALSWSPVGLGGTRSYVKACPRTSMHWLRSFGAISRLIVHPT